MYDDSTAEPGKQAPEALESEDMGGTGLDLSSDVPTPSTAQARTAPTYRGPAAPRATEPSQGLGSGAAKPLAPYLRGLVDGGAFDETELAGIPHRLATVKIAADGGRDWIGPLAHLAPDAVATIRRKAGSGHITGVIEWPGQGGAQSANFALYIAPGPDAATEAKAAPVDPQLVELRRAVERIERRETAPSALDLLGRELVMDMLDKVRKPVDPMEQISKVIGEVRKLTSLGARMKAELAPLMEVAQDVQENKPGALERFMGAVVSEENIEAAMEWLRDKATGTKTVDVAADVGEGADVE